MFFPFFFFLIFGNLTNLLKMNNVLGKCKPCFTGQRTGIFFKKGKILKVFIFLILYFFLSNKYFITKIIMFFRLNVKP